MFELCYTIQEEPQGSLTDIDLEAHFMGAGEEIRVKGFYAGNRICKVRFLPRRTGEYVYKVEGIVQDSGRILCEPGTGHGMVRTEGTHFVYEDGMRYLPFGTTVYAMVHQSNELMEQTFETLSGSPFNKIRFCVFPKYFVYNREEPEYFPFEESSGGKWNLNRPCMEYWERLEDAIRRLDSMGMEADLILFHPYDYGHWGFDRMSQADNLCYLDYAVRRLAAFPNLWWSLANEYDAHIDRTMADWEELEEYVAGADPFHHLLSCHNIYRLWDAARPGITHVSAQTKMLTRIDEWQKKYKKPVIVDECCYEGNIPESWGAISGREMVRRFWRVCATGGYCTHGETFLDAEDVLWWAKGGVLKGESPVRIAFLREIMESIPGALTARQGKMAQMALDLREKGLSEEEIEKIVPEEYKGHMVHFLRLGEELDAFLAADAVYNGQCGELAYLYYYDIRCSAADELDLPQDHRYRVEVIDTWNMTRETVGEHVNGKVRITLPGRTDMAVLATAQD